MKFYKLRDYPHLGEYKKLGCNTQISTTPCYCSTKPHTCVMAVKTGEKRSPLKGEWYISGAIPEAYRAPNNLLPQSFQIAKLVLVEIKPTIGITPIGGI